MTVQILDCSSCLHIERSLTGTLWDATMAGKRHKKQAPEGEERAGQEGSVEDGNPLEGSPLLLPLERSKSD